MGRAWIRSLGRRGHLVVFVALLALAMGLAGIPAFATPQGQAAESSAPEEIPPRAPTLAEAEEAEAELVEHRTPAELESSQTAFAELPPGEARELVSEEFPEQLEG